MTDDHAPKTALGIVQRFMQSDAYRESHLGSHIVTRTPVGSCRVCHALTVEHREARSDMVFLEAAIKQHDADREEGQCHAPLTHYVEEQVVFDGK